MKRLVCVIAIACLMLCLTGCGTPAPTEPEKDYSMETIREEVYGVDSLVKLADGTEVTAICFDNAATTPAFKDVNEEVVEKLGTYAYVGQGKGQKSAAVTEFYEEARQTVLDFVHADPELYTANTIYAEVDENGRLRLDEMERLLDEYPVKYVSITAASNVTGYVNDVHTLARMAHEHDALIIVDGAQIVPHRAFSMMGDTPEENIDFFVFSAHKMYAPYGGGAVVGLKSELDSHIPEFYGAGIVQEVYDEEETYLSAPSLYEAGSLNYTGIVTMVKAIEILEKTGYDSIQEHEQILLRKAIDGLLAIDGVTVYGDTENISDKIGIVTFNIDGVNYTDVASRLADTAGIDVGKGTFGAQPYVFRLLGLPNTVEEEEGRASTPGMVRVSLGVYNTEEEIDVLLSTVRGIAEQ